MTISQTKRRGRPPKPQEERKRGHFTFRVKDDIKARVERAAQVSGRSVSEEIEYRVEHSLEDQKLIISALGGTNSYALIDTLLYFLDLLERRRMDWRTEPAVAEGLQRVFGIIMEAVTRSPLSLSRQKELVSSSDRVPPGGASNARAASDAMVELALLQLQMLGLAEEPREPLWPTKLPPSERDHGGGK